MYYFFLGLISMFAAYGFICVIYNIYKKIMHCSVEDKFVVVTLKKHDAESAVRCIMREHPDSEIIVINKDTCCDSAEVLHRLEDDFPQIHIV